MGIIIDAFGHIMPKSFLDAITKAYPTVELKELAPLTYFWDVDNRLRVLDKHGIDKQVLTLARPSIWLGMPPGTMMELTRIANDAISEFAGRHPDRLIPVAHLPTLTEDYLPEFDRCINKLGMAGIHIVSNIDGKVLDAPEFRAFFRKASATKTPIWLHPQLPRESSPEFVLEKMFGWVYETTLALSRLVFSHVMEECPDLRIIAHHMAAMVPHFSERIRTFYEIGITPGLFPRANLVPLPKPVLDYFKKFYGDTVLNGALHAFECGYKFLGPEHILFGTDYPFGPEKGETWVAGALDEVNGMDLPKAEKELILGGNMVRLLERR